VTRPNLKFTTRAQAMDRYVDAEKVAAFEACEAVGVGYHDPRPHWPRIRNYEIERMLREQSFTKGDDDLWIVVEWCPFNGIHCAYFDVASTRDLRSALSEHRKYARRPGNYVAPFVFADIERAIEARGDQSETRYFPEGMKWSDEDVAEAAE
jgi:hypothetical protein